MYSGLLLVLVFQPLFVPTVTNFARSHAGLTLAHCISKALQHHVETLTETYPKHAPRYA